MRLIIEVQQYKLTITKGGSGSRGGADQGGSGGQSESEFSELHVRFCEAIQEIVAVASAERLSNFEAFYTLSSIHKR
jgi:hypothetical protein